MFIFKHNTQKDLPLVVGFSKKFSKKKDKYLVLNIKLPPIIIQNLKSNIIKYNKIINSGGDARLFEYKLHNETEDFHYDITDLETYKDCISNIRNVHVMTDPNAMYYYAAQFDEEYKELIKCRFETEFCRFFTKC
jgi:hypothetical protein